MIKFDKSKANSQFSTVAEGTYECFIDVAVVGRASTGSEGIKMRHKIRKDVEQPHGGQLIFDDIWYSEAAEWNIHNLLGSVGTPEDHPGFNDLKEIADYVVGKAIRITVKHRQWNNKTQVDVKSREVSEVGGGRVDSPFGGGQAGSPFPTAPTQPVAPPAPPAPNYTPTYSGQPADPNAPVAPAMGVSEDPFANSKGPIEVSEDDLPF